MGQCLPLHHYGGACGCGATHTTVEAVALNRDSGIIGFVCFRGGVPPANPLPRQRCPVCDTDRPVRVNGAFREHHVAFLVDVPDGLCPASGLTLKQAIEEALRRPRSPAATPGHRRTPPGPSAAGTATPASAAGASDDRAQPPVPSAQRSGVVR